MPLFAGRSNAMAAAVLLAMLVVSCAGFRPVSCAGFDGSVMAPMRAKSVSMGPRMTAQANRQPFALFRKPAKDAVRRCAAAVDSSDANPPASTSQIQKAANLFVNLFPVWTVIFAGAALKQPSAFTWLTTEYFTAGLALLMVSMGITLTPKDFMDVLKKPNSVMLQMAGCYVMMPALALGLGKLFSLSPDLIAGMVLVGSINGGQASNLCTYIAKGNVALSVIMTTATTLSAIFMTPLLCKTLLGAVVPVDALGIAYSTIQVVLGPIFVGMLLNRYAPNLVKKILPFAPIVGVLSTIFLVASAVAQVQQPILQAGLSLQIPVLLLHLIGGLIGFGVPKMLGFGETTCRTMAIETSMKSSAFGFLLAQLHFANFLTRVPSAVSVVWMAVTGSTLAVIWKYIPVPPGEENKD